MITEAGITFDLEAQQALALLPEAVAVTVRFRATKHDDGFAQITKEEARRLLNRQPADQPVTAVYNRGTRHLILG